MGEMLTVGLVLLIGIRNMPRGFWPASFRAIAAIYGFSKSGIESGCLLSSVKIFNPLCRCNCDRAMEHVDAVAFRRDIKLVKVPKELAAPGSRRGRARTLFCRI